MAPSEEGVYLPHSKDASAKYHVHVYREAVLASRDSQFEMFPACHPLLKMAAGKKAIILTPLPLWW
jgi:hypothetical protein